jgi:hypothetical protein
MFFKHKDVNDIRICGVCSDIYDDPRLLPCGHSACNACIITKGNEDKEFECSFCEEKHKPLSPENGFPINRALFNLVKLKAGNVHRNLYLVDELKVKLVDLKNECEKFKFNMHNGVDQVREHCIQLRNQVHLETDILIEEVHGLNEKLIGEIDKYEQLCLESFNGKIVSYKKDVGEILDEIDQYHDDTSRYLTEFITDDDKVADFLSKSNSYLQTMKERENSLKKIKFGSQILKFEKYENKLNKNFFGSLVYNKYTRFDFKKIKEINLNFELTTTYDIKTLIRHDNGDTILFYTDKDLESNIISFDIEGNVLNKYLKISNGQVSCAIKIRNGYCIRLYRGQASPIHFNGKKCEFDQNSYFILILTDDNFNYLSHKPFAIRHINGNKSNIVYIDRNYNYNFCDLKLNVIPGKSMDKIKDVVTNKVVDFEMNEKHIFFLCGTKKLKIFDLETFDLVKEIDTSADRIKLASTDILILFDSEERMVYSYNQFEDFDKLDEFYLGDLLQLKVKMSRGDKTEYLSFYNYKSASFKSIKLDRISF